MARSPISIVVMGVSGSGKTTVAERLAQTAGFEIAEADDFHTSERIAMMAAGIALSDEDRWPWLAEIRDWIDAQAKEGKNSVVTCSALKRVYRDLLAEASADLIFLWLDPPVEVLAQRLKERTGHFMPASLLASQLDALEPLGADEIERGGLVIKGVWEIDEIVRTALERVGTLNAQLLD